MSEVTLVVPDWLLLFSYCNKFVTMAAWLVEGQAVMIFYR